MPEDAYQNWLNHYDISRPHRTGRWRVRRSDILCIDLPPFALSVGSYECTPWISNNAPPSQEEYRFFCRWRDSDERRHKSNASAYLHFAKYRHYKDGFGASQVQRVKIMLSHIREAMTNFAQGNISAGETSMGMAWGEYSMLLHISVFPLIDKALCFSPGRRKGAVGHFTSLVNDAILNCSGGSLKQVIQHLETMSSHVQEVDWDSEEIWLPGEEKPRKFKTVANILARKNPGMR